MDSLTSLSNLEGVKLSSSSLLRFMPQPRTSSSFSFQNILNGLGSVASSVLESAGGLNLEYQALLQEQLETQRQMFLMSLYSNLEKSKHETQMAAVRNIRVG